MREYKRPLYQKRHYEDFARLIKEAEGYEKDRFVGMIIDLFRRDNPLFDVERFKKACDKEE